MSLPLLRISIPSARLQRSIPPPTCSTSPELMIPLVSPRLYACSASPELDSSVPPPRPDTSPESTMPPQTFSSPPALDASAYLQRASSARCHTHTFSVPPALDPSAYLQRRQRSIPPHISSA